MLLLLLACSSTETPAPAQGPAGPPSGPVDGDTLVVAANFDPGNLNPIVAPYALSGYYMEDYRDDTGGSPGATGSPSPPTTRPSPSS